MNFSKRSIVTHPTGSVMRAIYKGDRESDPPFYFQIVTVVLKISFNRKNYTDIYFVVEFFYVITILHTIRI